MPCGLLKHATCIKPAKSLSDNMLNSNSISQLHSQPKRHWNELMSSP